MRGPQKGWSWWHRRPRMVAMAMAVAVVVVVQHVDHWYRLHDSQARATGRLVEPSVHPAAASPRFLFLYFWAFSVGFCWSGNFIIWQRTTLIWNQGAGSGEGGGGVTRAECISNATKTEEQQQPESRRDTATTSFFFFFFGHKRNIVVINFTSFYWWQATSPHVATVFGLRESLSQSDLNLTSTSNRNPQPSWVVANEWRLGGSWVSLRRPTKSKRGKVVEHDIYDFWGAGRGRERGYYRWQDL